MSESIVNQAYLIRRGEKEYFHLPDHWHLKTFADLPMELQMPDIVTLTRRALHHPIGCAPLLDRVTPSARTAILVEDLTRTSPKKAIIETLIDTLVTAGVPDAHIVVVIALGTHRPLSNQEMQAAFGKRLVRRYRFVNHDCRAPDLVPTAHLSSGRVVKVNPRVVEADVVIGIGSIFPHPMNGFGGGAKILFPGVADFDSILEHHLDLTFYPGTALGNIEGNRFLEQVETVAEAAGLEFIINSIMDPLDRACDVVAGSPPAAHRAGIRKSLAFISHEFAGKADLTLISSFPYAEGPQIVKPLVPAAVITRKGGTIIWAADCRGNLPEAFLDRFESFHQEHGRALYAGVRRYFDRRRLILADGAVDFNMALALTLAIQNDFHIILTTADIPREKGEKLGVRFAPDLAAATAMAAEICPQPDVHIVPSGGIILPKVI